jgi:cardiolipin synthase
VVDVPSWLSSFPALGAIAVGTGIAIRVAALGIIPGNRKPSTGMSWLLLVLLSPAVGVVAFYLFGSTRLGTRRHQRQRRVVEAVARHR